MKKTNYSFLSRPVVCFFSLLLIFPLLSGCAGFDQLTAISPGAKNGPSAAECGTCHLDQFEEWQGSAHNLAYSSATYREATDNYQDEGCLPCHTPENIQAETLAARKYNRQDGISCPSCHLQQEKMNGPVKSSSLFSPHPIQSDPSFFRSSDLCGICHQDTFESWQKETSTNKSVPICQECHQAFVTRKATKGTNFFSKSLVAFEEAHQTRSHRITLSFMEHFADTARFSIVSETRKQGSLDLILEITNLLPHNLPGGAFGEKSLLLIVTLLNKENQPISISENELCCEKSPLTPGETRRISFNFDGIPSGIAVLPSYRYKTELVRKQPQTAQSITIFSTHLSE